MAATQDGVDIVEAKDQQWLSGRPDKGSIHVSFHRLKRDFFREVYGKIWKQIINNLVVNVKYFLFVS